jgi:hypothetical protein
MANKNIKEVEGGEVTTLNDADGIEIDTGSASVWIKAANLALEMKKRTGAVGGNQLINGGFDFAQRQIPATLTTYSANTYSADRWKAYAENASYQYQRQDGLAETGLTSQYFGAFKKITNAGKMFVYQIIEGKNSVPLRSKTVIFQCQMKASSSKTIRMGLFELATAGTIDSVPSPIVTAAGANSTDPTMGTNVAIITAAESKSVTTSMQTFSVSVTVPATSKNLICAVWTDSQFSANDILYIAEAGLYVGTTAQAWTPRPVQQELSLCKRYCQRTDAITGLNTAAGFADSTSNMTAFVRFEIEMFTIATCSFGTAVGDFSIRYTGGATTTATAISFSSPSTQGATLTVTGTGTPLTAGQGCQMRCVNANGYFLFEAEL